MFVLMEEVFVRQMVHYPALLLALLTRPVITFSDCCTDGLPIGNSRWMVTSEPHDTLVGGGHRVLHCAIIYPCLPQVEEVRLRTRLSPLFA